MFGSSIAPYLVFKGGTSLSKAWGLIDRFSEDIDLALDRKFLGFDKSDAEMAPSQVAKLRKSSAAFISETLFPELQDLFVKSGLGDVDLRLEEARSTDDDPITIEVYYPSITEKIEYIQPRVLIEIGSRSLIEPYTSREFSSFVGEIYEGKSFADKVIIIPTVDPERTFLEKVFLIHEEFQLKSEKEKVNRRSRHLYDLEKLMDTDHGKNALGDMDLYKMIVAHRQKLNALRGIDYSNHSPDKINLIPPDIVIGDWEKDYQAMQESMLYRGSLPFVELIGRIKELNEKINNLGMP